MAASSPAESRSWVTNIHYETLELMESVEEHARVYKAKERGTNKIFAVKQFIQSAGIGSRRYREAVKREGRHASSRSGWSKYGDQDECN